MVTPEMILMEVQRIAEIYKEHDNAGVLKEGAIPEYYPGYVKNVEDYLDANTHTERTKFPERLFREKSPNMSEEEENYLRANFKSITQPVYKDMVNAVRRAFSEGNWSITYNEDAPAYTDNSFQDYVEGEIDLNDYIRNIVVASKLKDPNGVIAVKVPKVPVIADEENERLIIDPKAMIEPKPFYYNVLQVVHFERDLVIIETGERSLVRYGTGSKQIGKIYEAYTAEALYKVVQVGKYVDWEFEIYLEFPHEYEEVPVYRLKGEPMLIDNKVQYESPFLSAVDLLDLALINKNNLEVSKQLTMYPFRVMVGDPCDFERDGYQCTDGKLTVNTEDGQKVIPCPSCEGSGLKVRPHRGGTMLIEQRSAENLAGDNVRPSEAIAFAQPSPEALRYIEEGIEKDISAARSILHLRDPDQKTTGDPTATGRFIDREDSYAFIAPISDQTFRLWKEILEAIGWMRYGSQFQGFSLQKAINFDFRTKADFLGDIKFAQEVGDPVLIKNAIMEYMSYTYHAEANKASLTEIIIRADRLVGLSNDQIVTGIGNKTIEPWEKVLHDSALYFLEELVEEEGYLSLEIAEQAERLKDLARQATPSEQQGETIQQRLMRAMQPIDVNN